MNIVLFWAGCFKQIYETIGEENKVLKMAACQFYLLASNSV